MFKFWRQLLMYFTRVGPAKTARPIESLELRNGFTLVELLLAVAIGGFVMVGATQLIISQTKSSVNAELAQRVRNDANRINYLINTEASEAVTVGTTSIPSQCAAPAGSTARFNLNIPFPTGAATYVGTTSPTNFVSVYYYTTTSGSNTDLRRCGPGIDANGKLILGTDAANTTASFLVDALINTNTGLTPTTCQGVSTGIRQVAYQLTLSDVPIAYQPPCAVARAKAYFVADPS